MDLHVKEGYLLGRVFKSKLDCGTEVVHEVFYGLELFGSARKIRKMSSMNLFQKGRLPKWLLCDKT